MSSLSSRGCSEDDRRERPTDGWCHRRLLGDWTRACSRTGDDVRSEDRSEDGQPPSFPDAENTPSERHLQCPNESAEGASRRLGALPIVRSKGKRRQARRCVRPGDAEDIPCGRTSDKGILDRAQFGLRRPIAMASTFIAWCGQAIGAAPTAPVAASRSRHREHDQPARTRPGCELKTSNMVNGCRTMMIGGCLSCENEALASRGGAVTLRKDWRVSRWALSAHATRSLGRLFVAPRHEPLGFAFSTCHRQRFLPPSYQVSVESGLVNFLEIGRICHFGRNGPVAPRSALT